MEDLIFGHENIFGGFDAVDASGHLMQTHANAMGGHDLILDGHTIDHTTPNIMGGENHLLPDGHMLHTTGNGLNGHNLLDSHGIIAAHTSQVGSGPINVFDKAGSMTGSIWPDAQGFHARFFS
jgi:hypothetical protein